MKNILITAAGSPGFITIQKAIRASRYLSDVFIHGCDINPQAIGLNLADRSFVVPCGTDREYIPNLLKYCELNKIDLLIPCADEELLPLAQSKMLFEGIGCSVLVADENSLSNILNKAKLYKFCLENNLSEYVGEYYLCNNINEIKTAYQSLLGRGYQVCVKPSTTHGSRGFRLIGDQPSREDFFTKKPKNYNITIESLCQILDGPNFSDLLVMEYLPGIEYSVDCFARDTDFLCVPRTRENVKEGICVSGKTVMNKDLIKASEKIYNQLNLSYNTNIQFKYDLHGKPKLLEINPRFSGTMEHCRAAGVNFVEVAIHEILNMKKLDYKVNWGVKMTRVWSEMFQNKDVLWTLDGGHYDV